MLYSIKDREDLENLEELVSLESQVKAVRFQDFKISLVNNIFLRIRKKIFQPVTKYFENTSQDITQTIKKLLVITTKQ